MEECILYLHLSRDIDNHFQMPTAHFYLDNLLTVQIHVLYFIKSKLPTITKSTITLYIIMERSHQFAYDMLFIIRITANWDTLKWGREHCALDSVNYGKEVKNFLSWTSEKTLFWAAGRAWANKGMDIWKCLCVWATMVPGKTKTDSKQSVIKKIWASKQTFNNHP